MDKITWVTHGFLTSLYLCSNFKQVVTMHILTNMEPRLIILVIFLTCQPPVLPRSYMYLWHIPWNVMVKLDKFKKIGTLFHVLSNYYHSGSWGDLVKVARFPFLRKVTLFLGGGVNVDCRFPPIFVVESTVFFNKSCRFVDRLFGQKTVDCRKSLLKCHRIVESTIFFKKSCRVVDFVSSRRL